MTLECFETSKEPARFLKAIEKINRLKDIDAILDRILLEARKIARADAGSIFLKEGDRMRFSYVHNDTLFREDGANAALYADFSVPIDPHSIVGCSALTGQTIAVDDAYAISPDLPYGFDPRYDRQSGYRTVSVLSIPLTTFDNKLIGVLQLINATDCNGNIVPFSRESRLYVPLFANSASVAIERGIMTRELILRMMRMAELHDPSETGAHVQKVGLFSAEIYQQWALNRGIDKQERDHTRELIRLAAMLHDAGKVGISDLILKKEGRLTPGEYDTMKWHAVYGARLFLNTTSDLDRMCYDIALCHHEKWNGRGYPGRMASILSDTMGHAVGLKGTAIPVTARITALADVFDALKSRRCYKDPWPEDKVLAIIREEAGHHFDPGVVEAFFQIYDVIKAIDRKIQD